jgi:hypothetical protein
MNGQATQAHTRSQQAARYLKQGNEQLGRGQFRTAELLLRQALSMGAGGPAPMISLGQSQLAQFSWWDGGINLYLALRGYPEDQRPAALQQAIGPLERWAEHLATRQLSADNADCQALVAALKPFPQGPVCFAARWIPAMSPLNGASVLQAFSRWARNSDLSSDPLGGDDLFALLNFARRCGGPETAVLRLYEGLMMHLSHAGAVPEGWHNALAGMLDASEDPAFVNRCSGVVLQNLFSRAPDAGLQESFRRALEKAVQSDAGGYHTGAPAAFSRLQQRLFGERAAG